MSGLTSLFYNKPAPSALIRWGQNKLKISSIIDGHSVIRSYSDKENAYVLDKEVLSAVKQSVPERVADVFNMGEINCERQLDPIFLMQSSSGDVARYFNKVLGLSEIDTLTTNLASFLRQTKRDKERIGEEKEALELKIKEYAVFDIVQTKLVDLKKQLDDYNNTISA
jgi:hypothetical protein